MARFPIALAISSLVLVATAAAAQNSSDVLRSAYHDYRVVTVADGLMTPWAIAFLPDGDMLVTERQGRLRIIREGRLLSQSVAGVPEVLAQGQGGLLDVVPHPDFETNRFVYLSFSKPYSNEEGATTAIIRARFENDALHDVEELFVANSRGGGHYGSRIVFDDDGYMFFSVGDRQVSPSGDLEAHPAQDVSDHHGTINRLHDDGRVPSDNPFVGTAGAEGSIYSYGHRNVQGLAIDRATGDIWSTEHGPQGGDEVNLVEAGANYGWPVVGYGVNYGSGSTIHVGTMRDGWENPVHVWVPSIGASGLMMYSGDRFPEWRGNLFAGGLTGEQLSRLTMDGEEVVNVETLVQRQGRIRDVREGPDGYIYLAIESRSGTSPIVRLEPAY